MGGWPYMALRLPDLLGRPIPLVSVPASSAPAAGSAKAHAAEQRRACVEAACAAHGEPAGADVYFTDRGIEELADRRGDETRSRWAGWPSGCASSWICTRRPRRRSTGWPAGWPASTTTS